MKWSGYITKSLQFKMKKNYIYLQTILLFYTFLLFNIFKILILLLLLCIGLRKKRFHITNFVFHFNNRECIKINFFRRAKNNIVYLLYETHFNKKSQKR